MLIWAGKVNTFTDPIRFLLGPLVGMYTLYIIHYMMVGQDDQTLFRHAGSKLNKNPPPPSNTLAFDPPVIAPLLNTFLFPLS